MISVPVTADIAQVFLNIVWTSSSRILGIWRPTGKMNTIQNIFVMNDLKCKRMNRQRQRRETNVLINPIERHLFWVWFTKVIWITNWIASNINDARHALKLIPLGHTFSVRFTEVIWITNRIASKRKPHFHWHPNCTVFLCRFYRKIIKFVILGV